MGIFSKSQKSVKDKYELKETLGVGSFAVVKEAVNKTSGQRVAIKIIDRKGMKKAAEDALEREIGIMRQCEHPNIIRLIETFSEAKKMYLVLELVSGGELFDRIVERERYSEKDAAEVIRTILESLRYLHNKGIVHRDLKPENILYEHSGSDASIKLADFGLACSVQDDAEVMNSVCGTPGYVAPEVLLQKKYDSAVDVWSVGVILYILLCGAPPFYDDNNSRLYEQIVKGQYDFPDEDWSDVSPSAIDLIKGMMTVNPDNRLSLQACIDHPWLQSSSSADSAHKALGASLNRLKDFNARRRLRRAMLGVVAQKRIERAVAAFVGAGRR